MAKGLNVVLLEYNEGVTQGEQFQPGTPIAADFTDADIVDGILTIIHNKNTKKVSLTLYVDGKEEDTSGMVDNSNPNRVEVDFGGSIGASTGNYILEYWT